MKNNNGVDDWVRIVPLGGLGRIGGNMLLLETSADMVMIDCGILFPAHEDLGIDYIIPDITYVLQHRHKLRGILLTHGHEDHIGALPYILPQLPALTPVYGTAFTTALLERKLEEFPDITCNLCTFADRERLTLGAFKIDPLAVTHSIPQAVAFAIGTNLGTILHTGDFKIDPTPLDGRCTDIAGLRSYGDAGVAVLLSDSTNAGKEGHTWSEQEIEQSLHQLIAQAPQRVFITTFASHIDRVQGVLNAALASDKHVVLVGRSMQQNVAMALDKGFLRAPSRLFVGLEHFNELPRAYTVVLASGTQGESQSAMMRIAEGRLSPIVLEAGDTIILSSRRIPGNERAIGDMINKLCRLGAHVITDAQTKVHTSGHAFLDEQREMLEVCRPQFFVPLHGEYRHMVQHATLAIDTSVLPQNAHVVEDGQPLLLQRAQDGSLYMKKDKPVKAGLVFVDGLGIGDVGKSVLRDRKFLSESGIIVCVVVFAHDGKLVLGPEIATRGLVNIDVDDNTSILQRALGAVRRACALLPAEAVQEQRYEAIRLVLRRFFRVELERKPVIVPIVLTLPGGCCG